MAKAATKAGNSALKKPVQPSEQLATITGKEPLPRTEVTEVVNVHAVDHMRDATLAGYFIEPREQLVLAVKAAVGIVGNVIGIVELVGLDVLVRHAELADEGLGIALVRLGQRGRIGGDG